MPAKRYDPAIVAAAMRRYMAGESPSRIAGDLGVSRFTVFGWVKKHAPERQPAAIERYNRSAEELGDLVYDTVVETLNALRARAIETGRPEWIQAQNAGDLAALDTAQWDRIIRVISAFRPRNEQPEPADGEEAAEADAEPEVHRNGAVDSAG